MFYPTWRGHRAASPSLSAHCLSVCRHNSRDPSHPLPLQPKFQMTQFPFGDSPQVNFALTQNVKGDSPHVNFASSALLLRFMLDLLPNKIRLKIELIIKYKKSFFLIIFLSQLTPSPTGNKNPPPSQGGRGGSLHLPCLHFLSRPQWPISNSSRWWSAMCSA